MAQTINFYQCHCCAAQWTAHLEALQADGCENCGQSNVAPMSEEIPDLVGGDQSDIEIEIEIYSLGVDAGNVHFDSEVSFDSAEDDWM